MTPLFVIWLGLSGAARTACAAETDIGFKHISVEPASVKSGESVRVNFTLQNRSNDDWAANRYQVSIEFLTAVGENIRQTTPLPVRSPLPAGQSKKLHINNIGIPPACSESCSLRILVLESDAMTAASPPFALSLASSPAAAAGGTTVVEVGDVSLSPASAQAGEIARVGFSLHNGSNNDWTANQYQVSAEFLTAAGAIVQKSTPIPVRSPLPAGQSKKLHINRIEIPPACSESCSLRVLVLENDVMIAASPPFALSMGTSPLAAAVGSSGVEISDVSLSPASAQAGEIVRVGFTLQNASNNDWAANQYQVSTEFLTAAGGIIQKSTPLPVRSPLPAGGSKKFHINKILPACSERCSLQILILENDAVVATSQPLAFVASSSAALAEAAPAPPASASTQPVSAYDLALQELSPNLGAGGFSGARLSAQNQMILTAADGFLKSDKAAQAAIMARTLGAWRTALHGKDISEEAPYGTVTWPAGGSLWRLNGDLAGQLDEWSDQALSPASASQGHGRLFVSFGGQQTRGTGLNVSGWNARLGSTLLRDRYDMSLVYNYNSANTTSRVTIDSYGLVARRLFPVSKVVGFNLGAQVLRNEQTGTAAYTSYGGVVGTSFFLPFGSFDISFTAGDHQSYGAQAGFTVFLTTRP